MMSLKKLPFIGIYVIMIKILVQSFVQVMLPISLFLIPFFLMFHMCLGGNVSQNFEVEITNFRFMRFIIE